MKKLIIKKIQDQAKEKFNHWPTIKIDKSDSPNLPLMNSRCMYNALNEYRSKRSVAILEVVNFNNSPVAHYISMDDQGRTYDTTLGWSWSGNEYRLSRYIHNMADETEIWARFCLSLN